MIGDVVPEWIEMLDDYTLERYIKLGVHAMSVYERRLLDRVQAADEETDYLIDRFDEATLRDIVYLLTEHLQEQGNAEDR